MGECGLLCNAYIAALPVTSNGLGREPVETVKLNFPHIRECNKDCVIGFSVN
jgi:hypothetical protein